MSDLAWTWLAAPYLGCAAVILAVALATALVRGDRVLRVGMIASTTTALPWALCQALAACTTDPALATRVLRVGQGPVALVGPNLLLVLLGASGQLERQRWIARLSGLVGIAFMIADWATDWTVPGVQRLRSGMFYTAVGPLTGVHVSLLLVWVALGLWIVRRSSPSGERRGSLRLVLGVLVCAGIGSLDTLLLYGVWGTYPIAWLPATVAAGLALYVVLRTDVLRPQGFDRAIAAELAAFAVAAIATALLALSSFGSSPVALAFGASIVWIAATAVAWAFGRVRPVRVASERALVQFVARLAALDDAAKIAERLADLWKRSVGIAVRAVWWREAETFARVGAPGETWQLPPDVVMWLARQNEAIATSDLATMRLGALRAPLEALGKAHGAGLFVPLVDREELVALVEADFDKALREPERGLLAESARATARALTFLQLARAASRERETAREVEIADALRLQASTSRDAELGRWSVTGEYRSAPRTTGAGWSAIELADGRLALLVTEAQAHGVAAALATAAITGAFAAATTSPVTLDELMTLMRASADGVTRAGESVSAFLAILDVRARSLEWACAGHPGALLVGPTSVSLVGTGNRAPGASLDVATRGQTALPEDTLLVVASTALRGSDDERWQRMVAERAPVSAKLATVLVETSLAGGAPREDLLAVVVRAR